MFLVLSSASAATYYVDFATGVDTANGTATGTPWKHCPGDTNATSVPLAATLVAGDTVKFKGAVEYDGQINVNWSGSNNSRITYDGNHSDDWGTGRAIIDNNCNTNRIFAFYAGDAGRNLITIQGFEIREIGGYTSDDPVLLLTCANPVEFPAGGAAIYFFAGGTNLIFRNLYLHSIGQWRNQPPFFDENSVTGVGLQIQGANDVTIDNVEISKTRTGISLKADNGVNGGILSNILITNVNIHNYIVWGIDIGPRAASCTVSNITIRNSQIHDMNEFDQGNWVGCGNNPHCDYIFIRTSSMQSTTWTNISIFNNAFYSDSIASSAGGTAVIYITQGPSANIYNNTFRTVGETRVIGVEFANHVGSSIQYLNILNNSFIDTARSISVDLETDPNKRVLNIQNNIFYSTVSSASSGVNIIDDLTSYTLNNNIYWHPTFDAATKKVLYNNGNYKTFAQVQALSMELGGQFINPLYMSSVDLHPQTNSPSFHAGANLSSLFTTDKDGFSRSSAWDVGAYQFVTNVPPDFAGHIRTRKSPISSARRR